LNLPFAIPEIGPAPVLALIVGTFHTSLYVLVRGSAGGRFPWLLAAATLGAYAGQALAGRLGDPLRIGDFGVLYSSLLAWVGLLVGTVVSVLAPARGRA
jgi:MFS family permease